MLGATTTMMVHQDRGDRGTNREEHLSRDDSLSSGGGVGVVGAGGLGRGGGDQRLYTERRKKTVRFDGQDSQQQHQQQSNLTNDEWSRWESERQGSQDSTTKDSGIDTSSTFTSSEDSNRGDGPKVRAIPVTRRINERVQEVTEAKRNDELTDDIPISCPPSIHVNYHVLKCYLKILSNPFPIHPDPDLINAQL